MNAVAQTGTTVIIKGEVIAHEDLMIAGRVEGAVRVEGHQVFVLPGAQIAADITARDIVIAGNVRGSLVATARIELRNGANVQGDLTTPALAMADGAVVNGIIDMPAARKPQQLAKAS